MSNTADSLKLLIIEDAPGLQSELRWCFEGYEVLQAKLLHFLQERTVERLGGRNEVPVDIRVLGATNRDLAQLIHEARFREDLYYRISEIAVNIPPLRERQGDRSLLAHAVLERFARDVKEI